MEINVEGFICNKTTYKGKRRFKVFIRLYIIMSQRDWKSQILSVFLQVLNVLFDFFTPY